MALVDDFIYALAQSDDRVGLFVTDGPSHEPELVVVEEMVAGADAQGMVRAL